MEEVPRTVKRVPLVLSLVIVVVLLASAGLVVYQIGETVKPMGEEFKAKMAMDPRYEMAWTGLPQLDRFLKVVHLVFTEYFLIKAVNFWFLEVWMTPCMALIFFQSIDFDRLSMRLVPLYVFFYQYVGIGICWPLALIYYLYRRNAHSGRFPGGSTPARVVIMGFSSIMSVVILAALPTLNPMGDLYFWLVNVFLLLPCILPLLTWLISSETAPRSVPESARGQRFENLVYAFFAGISFLIYWRAVPMMLEMYGPNFWLAKSQDDIVQALLVIWNDMNINPVQTFLLYDAISSVSVITCFILMDGGLIATFLTLLASPIISPGAAVAIYLLRRESIIYGTATGTWSTKINTTPPSAKKKQ